jgi:hypothetical protein
MDEDYNGTRGEDQVRMVCGMKIGAIRDHHRTRPRWLASRRPLQQNQVLNPVKMVCAMKMVRKSPLGEDGRFSKVRGD